MLRRHDKDLERILAKTRNELKGKGRAGKQEKRGRKTRSKGVKKEATKLA